MLIGFALGVVGLAIAVWSGSPWAIAFSSVLLVINGAMVRGI